MALVPTGYRHSTEGADDWELLQVRERDLEARIPLGDIEPLEEPEYWETDLDEEVKIARANSHRPLSLLLLPSRRLTATLDCAQWAGKASDKGKRSMQVRLELQLRENPLDYEKRPFSDNEIIKGVVDQKTTDGTPTNVVWIPAPAPDMEKQKQNSDHLMSCLKLWDLTLPNMCAAAAAAAAAPPLLLLLLPPLLLRRCCCCRRRRRRRRRLLPLC